MSSEASQPVVRSCSIVSWYSCGYFSFVSALFVSGILFSNRAAGVVHRVKTPNNLQIAVKMYLKFNVLHVLLHTVNQGYTDSNHVEQTGLSQNNHTNLCADKTHHLQFR